jgi:hypothetical protein
MYTPEYQRAMALVVAGGDVHRTRKAVARAVWAERRRGREHAKNFLDHVYYVCYPVKVTPEAVCPVCGDRCLEV